MAQRPVCWLLNYRKAQFRTFENAHNEYCLIAGKENEGCSIPRDCGSQNKMAQGAASRQSGWGTAVKQLSKTTLAHTCLPSWGLTAPELRVSVSRWEHCLEQRHRILYPIAGSIQEKKEAYNSEDQLPIYPTQHHPMPVLHTLKTTRSTSCNNCVLPFDLNELSHREYRPDAKKSHAKNELTISNPARYLRNANERGDKNLHPRKKNP